MKRFRSFSLIAVVLAALLLPVFTQAASLTLNLKTPSGEAYQDLASLDLVVYDPEGAVIYDAQPVQPAIVLDGLSAGRYAVVITHTDSIQSSDKSLSLTFQTLDKSDIDTEDIVKDIAIVPYLNSKSPSDCKCPTTPYTAVYNPHGILQASHHKYFPVYTNCSEQPPLEAFTDCPCEDPTELNRINSEPTESAITPLLIDCQQIESTKANDGKN